MKKITAAVLVITIVVLLCACSSPEDELVGKWYIEDNDVLYFTFFSDGTCKVYGEYGTCKWSVTDGLLKIINFYGQTTTYEYSAEGDSLTIDYRGNITEMYRQ